MAEMEAGTQWQPILDCASAREGLCVRQRRIVRPPEKDALDILADKGYI